MPLHSWMDETDTVPHRPLIYVSHYRRMEMGAEAQNESSAKYRPAKPTLLQRAVDVAWGLVLVAGCGAFAAAMGVV